MAELTKRQRKRERKRRRMRFEKSPPPARQPPAALAPPPQSTAEKRQFASSPDRQIAAGAGARAVPQPEQELGESAFRTCAEPGSSFCWGPVLQGSTSPSSSRFSTRGQADRARREVRQPPTPPPPCARTSHPTCPTHGSRTFRPPCILPTRRLHPRIQPTPSAALVRRSSTLPVD